MKAGLSPAMDPVGEAERQRRPQVQNRRVDPAGETRRVSCSVVARKGGRRRAVLTRGRASAHPEVRGDPFETRTQVPVTTGPAVRTTRKGRRAERPRYRSAKVNLGEALAAGKQQCGTAGGMLGRLPRVTPRWVARRTCPAAKASRIGEASSSNGENRAMRDSRRTV